MAVDPLKLTPASVWGLRGLPLLLLVVVAVVACKERPPDSDKRPDMRMGLIRRTINLSPEPSPVDLPREMSASQILVSHKGAEGAPKWVARTRQEAAVRAKEIAARVRKDGGFAAAARRLSDGPHSREGGYLGSWRSGTMLPIFEQTLAGLQAGGISRPFRTIYGYHIIQRHRPLPNIKIAAAHLLISYRGALRARGSVRRSREEALAMINRLFGQIQADPSTFAAMVRQHSDGPRAERGGPLGSWTMGRNQKPPVFDKVVSELRVGQVARQVVESPFGFHIFKRLRVARARRLSASHILIAYRGARRCPPRVVRTRAEALALARKLARQAKARPSRFAELAQQHSDDAVAARGGHLGSWPLGQGIPEFESAVLKLKEGQIGGPLETPAGYHVIIRHRAK